LGGKENPLEPEKLGKAHRNYLWYRV